MELTGERHEIGQEQARIAHLHGRFRAALERYFARRTGGKADVEDLVQDVFERLIRRGPIEQEERIDGYVFTTASNVLTDRHRRARVRSEHLHESFCVEQHGDADFSPEHVLAERERLARAAAILQQLPERTRTIFILRRLDAMRYTDIAAAIGISVSAVEKHMQRAMAHIAARMDEK